MGWRSILAVVVLIALLATLFCVVGCGKKKTGGEGATGATSAGAPPAPPSGVKGGAPKGGGPPNAAQAPRPEAVRLPSGPPPGQGK